MPLTLTDLLRDPIYRKWYSTPPSVQARGNKPSWRVWVQLESGRWAKVKEDYWTYPEAYNYSVKNLKKYKDIVVCNLRREFRPPVVRHKDKRTYYPIPRGYTWCGFCRRPTIFKKFMKHHALEVLDFYTPRCSICGVRQSFIHSYRSTLRSMFD